MSEGKSDDCTYHLEKKHLNKQLYIEPLHLPEYIYM